MGKKLTSIFEGNDIAALKGLSENQNLSWATLSKVQERLRELGQRFDADWAYHETTKAREKEMEALEHPEGLFDGDGASKRTIEKKINFIGRKMLEFERTAKDTVRQVKKIVWLFIALLLIWIFRDEIWGLLKTVFAFIFNLFIVGLRKG